MYDAIVLGTGGMGSAALWQLARRDLSVLGLDRYDGAHPNGSSHGATRVIRKAYFEHPDYVPLLHRAYELWEELEGDTPGALWSRTGVVEVGPPDGEVIPGVLLAADRYGLEVEPVGPDAFRSRFPHLVLPPGMNAVYEPDGGVLSVEACVERCLAAAKAAGAETKAPVTVQSLERSGRGWTVHFDGKSAQAKSLVVTAGAWSSTLFPPLRQHLAVLRKPLLWYPPTPAIPPTVPVYLYELPTGVFYGFPPDSVGRLKVAEHTSGDPVLDPTHLSRTLVPSDILPVQGFLEHHVPSIDSTEPIDHAVCMYTMSPDAHFILDSPAPGLALAAGLSGHGYKFAPVIGEILADLATRGESGFSLNAFAMSRLG